MSFSYEIRSTGHVEMVRMDPQGNRSRCAVNPHDQTTLASFAGSDLTPAVQSDIDAVWAGIPVPPPFTPPDDTPAEAAQRDLNGSLVLRALIRALNRPPSDPLAFVPGRGLTQAEIVAILIGNK